MTEALIWFRRDLRLTDNTAPRLALQGGGRVHCAFVFDTGILDALDDRADRRVSYIWQCVAALKAGLQARGGDLHVLHGAPESLIPALAEQLGAAVVYAARDYEPAARRRDAKVAEALVTQGRRLHLVKDQVIFDTDEVLNAAGRPFQVFTPYKRAWLARYGVARAEAEAPPEDWTALAGAAAPLPMPGLEALGFQPADLAALGIEPGEAGARAAFEAFRPRMARYKTARDFPAEDGTSRLSVALRFGAISIRELARAAWRQADDGAGAETWLSELIWRDFFQMLLWHFPHTTRQCFQDKYDALVWPNPPGHFEAWATARTGYPIVDAAMRQLEHTGYMHNRLRMIAASFLVKDLHVDWRLGEAHFARALLDYDQAANVGGWQWSAGTGADAQPWFRVFNPVTQSQTFDPHGHFIRRMLPELAAVPDPYLHAPWRMPPAAQDECGVRIGRDYPSPIVDHARARAEALALFRAVNPAPAGAMPDTPADATPATNDD